MTLDPERRIAALLADRDRGRPPASPPLTLGYFGVVSAVGSGMATVTVDAAGTTAVIPYVCATPTVGKTAFVLVQGPVRWIIGMFP